MIKKLSVVCIALVALCAIVLATARDTSAKSSDYLTGLVYIDSNQNGSWDMGEEGYKGAYGVAQESGNWIWRHRGTDVMFKGVGSGPASPIMLKTAGHQPDKDGAACTAQGDGRPCEGTFGFISFADDVTWQVSITVPRHYRLTSPATQTVWTGADNGHIDFGIVPAVIPPLDDTQPVLDIGGGELGPAIPGGSARMVRDAGGFSIDFTGVNLPAGHVVTLWAYTFNNPMACDADGCDEDDVFVNGMTPPLWSSPDGTVGRPGTDFSLMGLGGHVINASGRQVFTGRIADGTAPQRVFGNGLNNPLGAEVHFALRDHGPASEDPATLNAQLTSGIGGCRNFGGVGTYLCQDFQLAFFGR